MKKTIYRLEQAISFWEDYCFSVQAEYQILVSRGEKPASGLRGLLVNHEHLRQSMLNVFSDDAINGADKITEEYVFPKEAYSLSRDNQIMYLPFALLTWSRSSRRVFSLSRDLQVLLDATSLEGVAWSDIQLPFDSFVVTLERPLIDPRGAKFDTVLVAKMRSERPRKEPSHVVLFISFDSALERYPITSKVMKDRIRALLKAGSIRKAEKALRRSLFWGPPCNITTSAFALDKSYDNIPILES